MNGPHVIVKDDEGHTTPWMPTSLSLVEAASWRSPDRMLEQIGEALGGRVTWNEGLERVRRLRQAYDEKEGT
jgi:hypothetical protein